MHTWILPESKWRVKPPTAAEKAKRIQALREMTPETYAEIRRTVYRKCAGFGFDLDELLHIGLEIALTKYQGRTQLKYFVAWCAWHHAQNDYRLHQRWVPLADEDDEEGDEIDRAERPSRSRLGYLAANDPEPQDLCDEQLIERVMAILDQVKPIARKGHASGARVERAKEIVCIFVDSANHDDGIGVSEYNDAPQYRGHDTDQEQGRSNHRIARGEIKRHLCAKFKRHEANIDQAYYLFRPAFERALAERKAESW